MPSETSRRSGVPYVVVFSTCPRFFRFIELISLLLSHLPLSRVFSYYYTVPRTSCSFPQHPNEPSLTFTLLLFLFFPLLPLTKQYPKADGPRYTKAWITNSVMTALAIAVCLTLRVLLKRDNDRMDREEAEHDKASLDGGSEIGSRVMFEKKPRYVL